MHRSDSPGPRPDPLSDEAPDIHYPTELPDLGGGVEEPARRYFRRGLRNRRRRSPKQWLRTPVFGPGEVVCFECGHRIVLPYFTPLKACPECESRRFEPACVADAEP